jgi:putative salt-induced outer membrane protein YdiY
MLAALLAVLLMTPFARAAEGQKPKPWKGSAEVSFVNANGNTRSSTFANKDRFEYASGPALLELETGAMRGTSQSRLIAEQYFASEKTGYKWTEKDYAFEKLRWDKDRFAGVNNRYDFNVGLGRKLLDKAPDRLLGELGAGHVWEDRLPPAAYNGFASGRAYVRYERALSATSGFSQDAEYLHDFEKPRDYRLKTETAVTAALTTVLSLKLSFVWKRVGMPPPGFIKDDTVTSAALLVSL